MSEWTTVILSIITSRFCSIPVEHFDLDVLNSLKSDDTVDPRRDERIVQSYGDNGLVPTLGDLHL